MPTYPGGKGPLYHKIINLIPPHSVYVEPFAGGGAILRAKRPAALNVAIDLHGDAIEALATALTAAGAVVHIATSADALATLPVYSPARAATPSNGEASGDPAAPGDARRHPSPPSVLPPSPAMLQHSSDPSNSTNTPPPGVTAIPAATADADVDPRHSRRADPDTPPPARSSITPLPAMVDNPSSTPSHSLWYLLHTDSIPFLQTSPILRRPDTFVYADPPYLKATRADPKRDLYQHEMTTSDHHRLLQALVKLPCMVMISGYWSQLYMDTLAGWSYQVFQTRTRGGTWATEYVWMNYPPPTALHDYRYLGDGFRERERIKRKKARWVRRLQAMPTLERQALLMAIDEAWS